MRRFRKLSLFLAVSLLVPALSFGQAKVGTTGLNFLKIGSSARGVALADAFLAIADDASTLYYNPAGLINLKGQELVFTHTTLPADLNHDFLGAAMPLPSLGGAIGFQLIGLSTGDMIETTPDNPSGTGRTFSASDFSAGVSYAQRLTDKFSVGGTVKYLQENLADENAFGWAADVGTYYDTGWKSLRIAMVITNFGDDMTHVTTPFPLPLVFRFGVALDMVNSGENRVTLGFEGTHPNDNVEELHLGVEYAYRDFGYLRMGRKINAWKRHAYTDFRDNSQEYDNPFAEYPLFNEDGSLSLHGFSFGGGMKLDRIGLSIDYAWTEYGFLGSLHRFSIGYYTGR